MVFSEVLRLVLPFSHAPEFVKLREFVSKFCGVKDQHFGYMVSPSNAALPIQDDEISWVIQWPHGFGMNANSSFRAQLNELTRGKEAKSLLFQFEDTEMPELTKALEAPICQFAIINLVPEAPLSDPDLIHSMHKTYTDCYRMQGFIGGSWAYAANTNDTNGGLVESASQQTQEKERRLACYYLGWESIELHEAACATPIFAEEMVKLRPWFGPGSGAWYVRFKKHV